MKYILAPAILCAAFGGLITMGVQYEIVIIRKAHAFDVAYSNYQKQLQSMPEAPQTPLPVK